MTPLEVCHTLAGRRFKQVQLVGSPPKFHTWDFLSPNGAEVVRVTFDNVGLVLWGDPADEPDDPLKSEGD